ncbi:globin domain-containing protein [Streptomyces pactum]|uniref:globin domain-containing protein n=1 Tax=Streptomyces pactum TaxID=68249 RepID=UPI0037005433
MSTPHSASGTFGHPGGAGRSGEYHALLARHDAMRLRRMLLAPARPGGPGGPGAAAGPGAAGGPESPGTAAQAVILRDLPLVTPFDALIGDLYDAMFERHPYLRSLFPDSMEFQRRHLAEMFGYLIEHLDRPDEIEATCARLGRDHRKLGVRPAHYQTFEVALREALRRRAGAHWTEELDWAWVEMLRFAVRAMVAGADAALTEPPYWHADVTGHDRRGPDLAVLRVRPREPYPYRAGQHGAVESPLLPHSWRQYSFACAPDPAGEVEFHVRAVGPGGVSEALVAHTRVGDTVRLGPAHGGMTLDEEFPGDLLLVAGGTGWATAKSLLQELAARRPAPPGVHLFLGAREEAGPYDGDAVAELARRPWLRVHRTVGPGVSPVQELERHGDWSGHLAYVSGPPGMVAAAVAELTALGVPTDRIRHDPLPLTSGALPGPAAPVPATAR